MSLPHLEIWQWALAALGAFCVGLSKTGISGIGIVAVALFSLFLPARESTGSVLLILISADIVAVLSYRRDADWSKLIRLFPFTIAGVILGTLTMKRVDDSQMRFLIGGILLVIVGFQIFQRLKPKPADAETRPLHPLFAPVAGLLAGFTTMVANAAGPIMTLYLLAMRLPKVTFIGTAAWYFCLMNLFKVPFSIYAGAMSPNAPAFALTLFPAALAGGLLGRRILPRIDQKLFESLAIGFAFAAALYLILGKSLIPLVTGASPH